MQIKAIITDPRLTELPTRASKGAAAVDLRGFWEGDSDLHLWPGEQMMIDTGLRVWVEDPNYAALVLPRSSMGVKGLVLGNSVGLIDADYQGSLKVCLVNRSSSPQTIKLGERIAQLVVIQVPSFALTQVDDFAETTERGQGGFGSTGKL